MDELNFNKNYDFDEKNIEEKYIKIWFLRGISCVYFSQRNLADFFDLDLEGFHSLIWKKRPKNLLGWPLLDEKINFNDCLLQV